MAQNLNITKLDQRDALKRCINPADDTLRVELIDGSVTAAVQLSSESLELMGVTEEGSKVPLKLSADGKVQLDDNQLKLLVEAKGGTSEQPQPTPPAQQVTHTHEVTIQPLPKEYLERLDAATKALNEVALRAGREVVREIPVEKIVEKQIVTKEVPVWVWVVLGAQATALLITLL